MKGEVEEQLEMVVSYKAIHINQYAVVVVEMKTCLIKFMFEMYHLWESSVESFMNESLDYIILNKDGLSFIPMGTQMKKIIANPDGCNRMVHSLESSSYLKIEDTNQIHFLRPRHNQKMRDIIIKEQYTDSIGET